MDKIVNWKGISCLPNDPARCIELASEANLISVIIIGIDADGAEVALSSEADSVKARWNLDRAWYKLRQIIEQIADD